MLKKAGTNVAAIIPLHFMAAVKLLLFLVFILRWKRAVPGIDPDNPDTFRPHRLRYARRSATHCFKEHL
ncbi:hypothetical protein AGR4C_Cc160138 [Agrobacterium tumefaciens str. Kerr 14]|uniref:Uncharacterized protein n=1 Tax=Agrobacterium tumefaciens str. Kerr 14 TaxID=1183424 RepID=A0A1S7P743_AGRTU|nr:hypothetical protein AGR4C_Cc160138 [Agrobacterium tumefaciens str. Kerr 14]